MRFLDRLKFRLLEKRKEIDNKLYRIRVESEQQRAAKIRNRILEPGSISYGLHHKQNPLDFMNDVIESRRNKRMLKNEDNRKS